MSDAKKYILPQKKYADLVIHYFDKNLNDCYIEGYNVCMSLKVSLSSAVNIEPCINELLKYDVLIKYDYSEDLNKQTILFEGESLKNKKIDFNRIALNIIPQLDEITNQELEYDDNLHGIIEILLLILISTKMQGDI